MDNKNNKNNLNIKTNNNDKNFIINNIDAIIDIILAQLKDTKIKYQKISTNTHFNNDIFDILQNYITLDNNDIYYQFIFEKSNKNNYILRITDKSNKNWFFTTYTTTKSNSDFSKIDNKNQIDIDFSNNKNINDYITRHITDNFILYKNNILLNIHKTDIK